MSICDEHFYYKRSGYDVDLHKRHDISSNEYTNISLSCCHDNVVQGISESPMPWIGLYVAAASLVCSIAMAADVFQGFRHRKLWFPCRFFTLNAASLTLLAVAMKLPVDLSTQLPTAIDQLSKLTSMVFMCTTLGNFMPSLGAMDDNEIFMNITALAILVITISVNICIQFVTLVIHRYFLIEYIATVIFMLALLLISSFSALMVPSAKKSLQVNYDNIHEELRCEESEETKSFTTEKMKINMKKYWMMAKSSCPQFVVARSVTCCASGVIGFLALLTLAEGHIRVFISSGDHSYTDPYRVASNYKWSTFVILVMQTFGVVVGSIAQIFRCFVVIRLRPLKIRGLKTENYWIEILLRWKESPLGFRIRSQICRKRLHIAKNLFLDCWIGLQIVIVVASKLVMLISAIPIRPLLLLGHLYRVLKEKITSQRTTSSNHKEVDHLSRYVLYLEGEEDLPFKIMKNDMDTTDRFIKKGEKQRPKYFEELIGKSNAFEGVAMFDSDQVPSLISKEPPNCWSLPVVTLTSIAISLPNIEMHKVKWLLQSVSEGLFYANLVEELLNARSDMVNVRNAASIVWSSVDVSCKWLDEDLRKIAREGDTSMKNLEILANKAKKRVDEFKAKVGGDLEENSLKWPVKAIAANSMYRISKSVLQIHKGDNNQTPETLFKHLCSMIAGILSACLINFPRVITMKCFCSSIEKREESVLLAAQLLGETEEMLRILKELDVPSLNSDKLAYIDEWRAILKQESPML